MAENSKIEWCQHTFNHILGCTKVAEGCKFCYAEALMDTRYGKVEWGPNGTRVLTSPANWKLPLKWNREAAKAGVRARVFCASLADVFEDWAGPITHHRLDSHGTRLEAMYDPTTGVFDQNVPRVNAPTERLATMDDCRRRLFALIDATPHLDWLLLTKRPENVRRMMPTYYPPDWFMRPTQGPRKNCWLGCSIATQADADKNIPELLKCRDLSPVLFVSAEPLIEEVNLEGILTRPAEKGLSYLSKYYRNPDGSPSQFNRAADGLEVTRIVLDPLPLDWLIIGGESGPHARPCDVAWIRSLKDQCAAAGVPCFVKQLGANRYDTLPTEPYPLKDAKGGNWNEWCDDLRVREFPQTKGT